MCTCQIHLLTYCYKGILLYQHLAGEIPYSVVVAAVNNASGRVCPLLKSSSPEKEVREFHVCLATGAHYTQLSSPHSK